MKSSFFTSENQDYPIQESVSLSRLSRANKAIEASFTDVYRCPYMRMCMPC